MALVTDVVIIGGGISGIATAYYLSENGLNAILLEKDHIAAHSSGKAYGGIGHLGRAGSPSPNDPIVKLSLNLHESLEKELDAVISGKIKYEKKSIISLVFNEKEADKAFNNMDWAKHEFGASTFWVNLDDAINLEPRINKNALGAVITEGFKFVNPESLTNAIGEAAKNKGVKFVFEEAVNLKINSDKTFCVFSANNKIECYSIVLAMGPWVINAGKWINTTIPVKPLKGQILRLKSAGNPLDSSIHWGSDYATSKPDGLIWTGSTEEEVGFDLNTTIDARNKILKNTVKMLPYLKDSKIVKHTACLRPVTSDWGVVLGECPEIEGIYIASGGGRSGLMLGPGIGKVTSDLISKGSTDVDISNVLIDRFYKNSV